VRVLEVVEAAHAVRAHHVVHVHADGVADFAWQARLGAVAAVPRLPIVSRGELEDDTCF
jgi:hypothetical protein